MAIELQIIRASEFIRLGAQGHFDLAASKAALAELARACRKRGVDRAMVDLREIRLGPRPMLTRDDLIALVNTFPEAGFTRRQRLALLYRADPYRRARIFAFLTASEGWNVAAFDDFEKSMFWLSGGEETAAAPTRSTAGKAIAVKGPKCVIEASTIPVASPKRRNKGTGGARA